MTTRFKSISSRTAMMLLLMLLTSVSAWAQDTEDYIYCGDPDDNGGQNVTWSLSGTISDCTLTISGTGAMADYDDSDECPWCSYTSYITSIVIEDGVTSIGENAFIGCSALGTVTIGTGVKTIGENAFYGCMALGTVTIPDNVKTIGDYAFIGCIALETLTIGNGVETIGDGAFSDCPLKTLSINMENITDEAFWGSSLTTVTFGTNVKTIGEGAFFDCTSLGTVTIGNGLETIGDNAFSDCPINTLNINMENISDEAFLGSPLTTVTFGTNVKTIGERVFSGCTSLGTVTIPANVETIGDYAFMDCTGLTTVTIGCKTIGDHAFYGCTNLGTVTIPDNVETIGLYAFMDCTGLTTVTIGCKTIGDYAFFECSNLGTVTIDNGVETIGEGAFSGCHLNTLNINMENITDEAFSGSSLTTVTFGTNVKTIGEKAFSICTSLTSVTIPASVTNIGADAFLNCTGITDVYCYADPDNLTWEENGCDDFITEDTYPNYPTKCHVLPDKLKTFKTKWSKDDDPDYTNVNVKFVGDLGAIVLSETQTTMPTLNENDKVVFSRTFIKGVASTVCLPFSIDATQAAEAGKFYTFAGVDKSGTDWEVIMQETTPSNLVSGALLANTPYLFVPAATGTVLFYGEATASSTAGKVSDTEGWTFKGTYTRIDWTDDPQTIYGFAATNAKTVSPGTFFRVAGGSKSYILPFRAYLDAAGGGSAAPRRGAASENLPSRMTVRLVNADSKTTSLTPGSPGLSKGEGSEYWYDLSGRRIESSKIKVQSSKLKKGIYVVNGKKVVIK